jgi:hypothetical protein
MGNRFLLLALLLEASATWAQSYTGNSLLSHCQDSASNYHQGYCLGFIVGQVHGYNDGREGGAMSAALGGNVTMERVQSRAEELSVVQARARYYCLPDGVTNGQLFDIVVRDLKDSPEKRHLPAQPLIWSAMRKAFPCR